MSSNILGLFWERKTNVLNLEQLKAKQTTLKSFSLSLFQEFSCKYYSRQKSFFFFFKHSLREEWIIEYCFIYPFIYWAEVGKGQKDKVEGVRRH